jgi:hypothetical protein
VERGAPVQLLLLRLALGLQHRYLLLLLLAGAVAVFELEAMPSAKPSARPRASACRVRRAAWAESVSITAWLLCSNCRTCSVAELSGACARARNGPVSSSKYRKTASEGIGRGLATLKVLPDFAPRIPRRKNHGNPVEINTGFPVLPLGLGPD